MSDNDYIRRHYPHTQTAQLARILGRKEPSIIKQANKLGVFKASERGNVMILASNPDGYRAANKAEGAAAWRLFLVGKMYKVKIAHKNVRYFANKADAERFEAKIRHPGMTRIAPVTISRSRKGWGPDDPPYFDPARPPKITIAPPKPDPIRTAWGPAKAIF